MLNSYKTLINGIATAVNALKSEVKNKFAAVDSKISAVSAAVTDGLAAMPVEDDLTIVRDSDGKLSTSLGAYERNIDITWDYSLADPLPFSYKIPIDSGYSITAKFYRVSDKVLRVDDLEHANVSIDFFGEVWSDLSFDDLIHSTDRSDDLLVVNMNLIANSSDAGLTPAIISASKDGVKFDGGAIKKGTYFIYYTIDTIDDWYITIKELRVERLNKIDEKFLPVVAGETIFVRVSGSGTSGDPYIADKDYDEIVKAYDEGSNIIALWEYGGQKYAGHLTARVGDWLWFSAFMRPGSASPLWMLTALWTGGKTLDVSKIVLLDSSDIDHDITNPRNSVPSTVAVRSALNDLKTNFILNSSTSGSNKQFKITVDDSGTISATEVTS